MYTMTQVRTIKLQFETKEMARKAMIDAWNEFVEGKPDDWDSGCNNDDAWVDA